MDKRILIQYADMQEEIKDLRIRISRTQNRISQMEQKGYVVKDSVKGTRPDGTYGPITITGFPYPQYNLQKKLLRKQLRLQQGKEAELLKLVNQVEEYINGIPDSRMRRIFRYRYIDDLNWVQVAHRMGKQHTADGCRMAHDRFMEIKK